MAACVIATQQPDGSYALTLDPANQNLSTCQYVLESGSDYGYGSLFDLTPDQALDIGTAIVLCWTVGWTYRQVIRALGVSENVQNEP